MLRAVDQPRGPIQGITATFRTPGGRSPFTCDRSAAFPVRISRNAMSPLAMSLRATYHEPAQSLTAAPALVSMMDPR
jgi:hypothetical protein